MIVHLQLTHQEIWALHDALHPKTGTAPGARDRRWLASAREKIARRFLETLRHAEMRRAAS